MKKKCTLLFFCVFSFFVCANLFLSKLSAQTFGNVVMGGGGYVTGIITCPTEKNLIYAKTDVGGAYRWQDSTKSWIPLLDWCGVTSYQGVMSLAVDPQLPNRLYILAGTSYWNGGATAILRSDDYGKTFKISEVTSQFKVNGNGANRQQGEPLMVDPNNSNVIYCGSRANGLFKSTDAGVTWKLVDTSWTGTSNVPFVTFNKFAKQGSVSKNIFVGVLKAAPNLYQTNDGGVTWTPMVGGPNSDTSLRPQRCVMANDSVLYVTYTKLSSWGGAIWKYNLKTRRWANISPMGNNAYCGISVDNQNPKRLLATTFGSWQRQPWGFGDRVFVSENAGVSWLDLFGQNRVAMNNNGFPWATGHALHWASSAEIDPYNSNRAFVTSGNGIFATENLLDSINVWKFMVKGLEETVPGDAISIPGGRFVSVIMDLDGFVHNNIYQAPNSRHSPAMGSTGCIAFAAKNKNFLVRASSKRYYSTNQGASWTAYATDPDPDTTLRGGRIALSANGRTSLWSVNKTTYRTNNWGLTWDTAVGLGFNFSPLADPVNAAKFYAYNSGDGYMYVSLDSGKSFARRGFAARGGGKLPRVNLAVEGDIWLPLNNGGLHHSINSGASFSKLSSVAVCNAVGLGKAAVGASYPAIYIWGRPTTATVNGLYRSIDAGATWIRVNNDLHQYGGIANGQFVLGDENVFGRVYMSTAGRGIVVIETANMASPLPVTWLDINGVYEQQQVNLQWKTTNEINNQVFEVQRSIDGLSFVTIGFVNSKTVQQQVNAYQYSDAVLPVDVEQVFYRLKQVDKNGASTVSKVVAIQISRSKQYYVKAINPFSKSLSIQVTSSKAQQANVQLLSASGLLVAHFQTTLQQGNHSYTFSQLPHLESGAYVLKVLTATGVWVQQLVKQ